MRRVIQTLTLMTIALTTGSAIADWRVAWERRIDGPVAGEGNGGWGDNFNDLYPLAEDGYTLCGETPAVPDSYGNDAWVVRVSNAGNPLWQTAIGAQNSHEIARTIIETDNGDLLTAGYYHEFGDDSEVFAARLSQDGQVVWNRTYGGAQSEDCYAVIELKEGNFLLGAASRSFGPSWDGYVIKIDGDGNMIWQQTYGEDEERNEFIAMREMEGGVLLAGYALPNGERMRDVWLVKINLDGELLWERRLNAGNASESPTALVSCRNGGFALSGHHITNPGQQAQSDMLLIRLDAEADFLWRRTYDLGREMMDFAKGLCALPDGGFALVGYMEPHGQIGAAQAIVIVDAGGNEVSRRILNARGYYNVLKSVVLDRDGAVTAAGAIEAVDSLRSGRDGYLIKLAPERMAPLIVARSPENGTLRVLVGGELEFWVRAVDAQDDSLWFNWWLDGELLDRDSTCTIRFDDLRMHSVSCAVWDTTGFDSTAWTVDVRDLFISRFTPDTLELSLRRGSSVDFSVGVAAVEGDPVNYAWTLANLDNPQPEVISRDSLATIEFLRSGSYALEAIAGRGESFDVVNWTIAVRGAVWSFWPDELSLTVPPDTVINFGVNPFNPESDSLSYAWYFGEDLLGMDSTVDVRFGGEGRVEVTAIVADGAEVDTLLWDILVQPPDAVESNSLFPLSSFTLSASPNPFNASTTIRWTLPSRSAIKLKVFDLSGRQVTLLVDREEAAGEHSVVWEGTAAPAGVYLIRLESNLGARTAKVVMIK